MLVDNGMYQVLYRLTLLNLDVSGSTSEINQRTASSIVLSAGKSTWIQQLGARIDM